LDLPKLFQNNREWARRMREADPDVFLKLSRIQKPDYLWVGCSDSRVPANQLLGLAPGELFVHRNVANIVVHSDLNFLSVLQFAIEVLSVRHIIVCGHYGCGGVRAALDERPHGLIDHWLRHIRDVREAHRQELDALDSEARVDRLCELNVIQQVKNIAVTNTVQNAWARGTHVTIHGWIYRLTDGLLKDLGVEIRGPEQVPGSYRFAR